MKTPHQPEDIIGDRLNLSPKLADVLEKMLKPFIDNSFESATEG